MTVLHPRAPPWIATAEGAAGSSGCPGHIKHGAHVTQWHPFGARDWTAVLQSARGVCISVSAAGASSTHAYTRRALDFSLRPSDWAHTGWVRLHSRLKTTN